MIPLSVLAMQSQASGGILGLDPTAFFTALLVAVTLPLAVEAARRTWLEYRAKPLLLVSRVRRFKPNLVVTAYGVQSFFDYWPTPVDTSLLEALRNHENVLLAGRPHVGKSRTATHFIRKVFGTWWTLSEWRIIRPLPDALDQLSAIRLPKRRYVLFLDDLDVFLAHDESRGVDVLQLVGHLQPQCRKLVVVATIRRTLPEFESLASSPHLLGRWRLLELPDWEYANGKRLAQQLGVDFSTWDGTPLSLIQPSGLMAERYRQLPAAQRKALRAMKVCFDCELYFVPRQLLSDICTMDVTGIGPEVVVNDSVVSSLSEGGWLAPLPDPVQSYPGLLAAVKDWTTTDAKREALMDALIAGGWHRQLAAIGGSTIKRGDSEAVISPPSVTKRPAPEHSVADLASQKGITLQNPSSLAESRPNSEVVKPLPSQLPPESLVIRAEMYYAHHGPLDILVTNQTPDTWRSCRLEVTQIERWSAGLGLLVRDAQPVPRLILKGPEIVEPARPARYTLCKREFDEHAAYVIGEDSSGKNVRYKLEGDETYCAELRCWTGPDVAVFEQFFEVTSGGYIHLKEDPRESKASSNRRHS